jgi:hypothetical protein
VSGTNLSLDGRELLTNRAFGERELRFGRVGPNCMKSPSVDGDAKDCHRWRLVVSILVDRCHDYSASVCRFCKARGDASRSNIRRLVEFVPQRDG